MNELTKTDVEVINKSNKETYYVPKQLFDGPLYKRVRVEVKWAYVAILNVALKQPLYEDEQVYVAKDDDAVVDMLKVLANKKVDRDKMNGYYHELEDLDLVTIQNDCVFIRKVG